MDDIKNMNNIKEKLVSLNTLYKEYAGKGNPINWIFSYPTLKKWVIRDLNTNNFLGTKVIPPGKGKTSVRYLIPVGNIDSFVRALHNGTIYAKKEGTKIK